jgi:hypothetical protein
VQTVTLDGLPPGFVWVRLRGVNNRGYGSWSSSVRALVV